MRYAISKIMLFILCVSVVTLYSCRPSKQSSYKAAKKSTDTEMGDQINFVMLEISHDSTKDENSVHLLGQRQGAGKMKTGEGMSARAEDYLVIDVIDDNEIKYSFTIDHPLYQNREYTGPDGQLMTRKVTVNRAEFFIRFQYFQGSPKLRISEKREGRKLTELDKIKL